MEHKMQIRYESRVCTDQAAIDALLTKVRVGVVGMNTPAYPYCVPVNFLWYEGAVYFHGAGSGKKEDLLSVGPMVTFTVYEESGTVKDAVPCHADTAYQSVMLFGKAEKVTDFAAAAGVMQAFLEKFMPGFYKQTLSPGLMKNYRSGIDGKAVSVYKIQPLEITAKENVAKQEELF
ncbi:MAG: pyridoxamine 5'-phosphate oxidase family protein [Lachnospiraceae bacterium]